MSNNDHIIDVSESSFEQDVVQQSFDIPVVVDFWAPWCGPCRMLGPVLELLANEPDSRFILAKVNVDDNPNLSVRYGVRGIPAVKAFVNGQIAAEFVGAQPEPILRQFIRKITPAAEDVSLNAGRSLLLIRHWAEAEQAFREALTQRPSDQNAGLGLAQALLAQGRGAEAANYLQRPFDGALHTAAETLLPLAEFLRDYGGASPADNLPDCDLAYHQAARLLQRGNLEAGMDGLLDVLRLDKRYRKGEPRRILLALFALLGEDSDVTRQYRQELASVLY